MANFMGGSAPAMAAQVADGFVLLNANSLKGYTPGDLTLLKIEMEKLQREARSVVPAQDDALANQARNRKINRLGSAIQLVGHKMTERR
ncbi:MAG: hypothetical protein ACHQNV_05445 [Vicinamibacteria bacterium]